MTAEQYREQLRQLLPPGRALDDYGQGVLTDLLDGTSQELARVDASAWNLIDESLPDSTIQLLSDWERVCALPDDCTPAGQNLAQRRQAVIARLIGNGTPSIPYLTDVAAALGYTATITRRRTRRSGMACGTPYGGIPWQFTWQVKAPLDTVRRRMYGLSLYGESYASWQNAVLECVMRQHAPAHTVVQFDYYQSFSGVSFAVDGNTADFQLTDGQGHAVSSQVEVTAIHRTDWQGRQQLYPTPRTNALVMNTEDLTGWYLYNCSVTSVPGAAPDGSAAFRIAGTHEYDRTEASLKGFINLLSGTLYRARILAKAETQTLFFVYQSSSYGPSGTATFNLATMTASVTAGTGVISAYITDMGDGWCLCEWSFLPTINLLGEGFWVDARVGNTDQTLLLAKPMATQGQAVMGSYIPNTAVASTTVTDYVVDASGAGVLGIEPPANLAYLPTAWTPLAHGLGSAPTITPGYTAGPDGASTATRIQCDLGGGDTTADYSWVIVGPNTLDTNRALSMWARSTDGAQAQTAYIRIGGSVQIVTVPASWTRLTDILLAAANLADNTSALVGLRGGSGTDDSIDILVASVRIEDATTPTFYDWDGQAAPIT